MGLRELDIKPAYDSEEDDVLTDFYIPLLSQSISYNRLAGFFSSTALAVAAKGISAFVANDGQLKLIASAKLSKSDVEAIQRGIENQDKVIEETMLRDLNSLEDEFIRDHVRALGWMVANKKLEIKVAIITDENGSLLDEESIEKRGIFHQKVGIFEDKDGNSVSFSGSINESATAWTQNIEEFNVFRSWIDGEREHLKGNYHKFEKYWRGAAKHVKVVDIPFAVREKLIQIAPANFEDLKFIKKNRDPILRDYQIECVQNWLKNNGKGLVEMATGTGKTFIALACLKESIKKEERLAVVITCPFIHLISQWQRNADLFKLKSITAFGSVGSWSNNLMNEILDLNNGYNNILIVITTHDTFSNETFINSIRQIRTKILVIADEVHGLGSKEHRKGLIENYTHRIGLSATPRRWLDDEGTEAIIKFFGDTVFEFPLSKAIPEFLTPYEYYPHFIELNIDEEEEYKKITKKIAIQYLTNKKNENRKLVELYLIERQRIVVNAQNKIYRFKELIKEISPLSHCLIYCSPRQINIVQQLLNENSILQHKFTAKENLKERDQILTSFADGKYQALVAMKCLDEGVDVPSTKIAIILASSGNPKEFIQRRGRILRKYPGKEKSIIYDLVVIPTLTGNIDPEYFELERGIIQRELQRLKEFSSSSLNPAYTLNKVYPIQNKYNIY